MELQSIEKQYIAGIIDGDGCIKLLPSKGRNHPQPQIWISQSYDAGEPPELVYLKSRCGGTIQHRRPAVGKIRRTWFLQVVVKTHVETLLRIVADHGIIKRPQAIAALHYMHHGDETLNRTARVLQAAKKRYAEVDIDPARVTEPYITGLFVADGYMGMARDALRAAIIKRSCPGILIAIQAKLGYGHINQGQLKFGCNQVARLAQILLQFMQSCQKQPQVQLALQFAATKTGKRKTQEDITLAMATEQKLKQLKKG